MATTDNDATASSVQAPKPPTDEQRPKLGPVTQDELIEDRALEPDDPDEFRLKDFAEELAQRCRVTKTPANIALYGAWGSGKSSLGNLLKAAFKKDPEIAFGRFDAFKFAEVPLRRHFLASVADWFKIKDDAYSEDLYATTVKKRFRLTARGFLELGVAIFVAAVVLTLVTCVAALIIAALATKAHASFGHTFVATLRTSAPGILIAVPIVGVVLAMAFDRFQVTTTTSAPFSDEEFEKRFKRLVVAIKKKTGKKRVLIFIDELDRCSPKEVGSVLETLRTFLDVKSCIFIVAADQQVLEHALDEGGARQATPDDDANPYYSSGSAYLDKIFHQQIPLPPLLPRTLAEFAFRLIENRDGVWRRVPNHGELVSVLVPTHIRSPRRVKALLNMFSSLYRLAILRAEANALDKDVEARASEVAKLVCLRAEFPLFARDLTLDARLPEIVLALSEKPELTPGQLGLSGVAPEVFQRARAYAAGRLPVAELLSYSEESSPVEEAPATDETAGTEDAAAEVVPEASGASSKADDRSLSVQRTYALQLIRYLQRTRAVDGPRRDLIYLESSGQAFGLPAEFADSLEDEARNGRAAQVAARVRELPESDQLAACRLLARLIVEDTVGLETANVVGSLFAAIAVTASVETIAGELLANLANYATTYTLSSGDLEGALRLSLASRSPAARAMQAQVLARDEAAVDRDLGIEVLEAGATLLPRFAKRFAVVLAARVADTRAEDVVEALETTPDGLVARAIAGIPAPPAKTAEEDEESTIASDLREFSDAALAAGRPILANVAFDRILAVDTTKARNEAAKVLPRLAPVSEEERCLAVLDAVQHRQLKEWPAWLVHLTPGTLKTSVPDHGATLLAAVTKIWTSRFPSSPSSTPPSDEDVANAATALAAAASEWPLAEFDASDRLASTQPSSVTAEDQIAPRTEQHATLRTFADAGLISSAAAADAVLGDLGQTLAAGIQGPFAPPFVAWVSESSIRSLTPASPDAVGVLVEAVDASPWLDQQTKSAIRLLAASRLYSEDRTTPAPLTSDEIAELVAAETPLVDVATSRWVEVFRPSPEELLTALRVHAYAGTLSSTMRTALGRLGDSWNAEQRAAFFEAAAPSFVDRGENATLLRELRMGGADPDRIARELIRLFEGADNNTEREQVLRLWEIAHPSSQRARQALIDGIFVPLIKGGKGQANLALDHFSLVANVGGPTQKKVKQAFDIAAANDEGLQKRVNRVLQEAGWIKRPRFKIR